MSRSVNTFTLAIWRASWLPPNQRRLTWCAYLRIGLGKGVVAVVARRVLPALGGQCRPEAGVSAPAEPHEWLVPHRDGTHTNNGLKVGGPLLREMLPATQRAAALREG